ncbi:MAG TPA: hypothetical protein VM840_11290 [Actinomycetota bacterium]|nr:hypothetical protein [Actinomycetota bacterium]
MTPADYAASVGYLMAAAGAMLGVWAIVVKPWRAYEVEDDPEDGATPDGPQDR